MPTFRKVAIVFLLAAFLASGASATASRFGHPEPAAAETSPRVLLNRAWAYLSGLWNKTGCKIDPNGQCITAPIPVPSPEDQADTGCGLDPDGRCRS
jgi:hypothetical protein